MTRKQLQIIKLLLTYCIAQSTSYCAEPGTMIIKRFPDPTGLFPSSQLYSGTLLNDTKSDILLEAIRMPDGYAGSGTFFACFLEQWDAQKKKWNIVWPKEEARSGKPNRTVRIKPGEQKETCRNLLPHDGGSLGSCMRFRLETSWEKGEDNFLSVPFVVGKAPGSSGCPAEGKTSKRRK
jgi:hypothetical protein